jgi:hypothetical protein
MKALSLRIGVVVLAVLAFAAMPRTAAADTYTLDGLSIGSFSLGSGSFTVTADPISGASVLLSLDNLLGSIPNLFVDDLTTGTVLDFKDDWVGPDSTSLLALLFGAPASYTVSFSTVTSSAVAPEPSSLLMLGAGLIALAFAGRKLRGARSAQAA